MAQDSKKTNELKDIINCIDHQLELVKKEYCKKYGFKEASGLMKSDAFFLQGIINALAWVKVFAIDDKNFKPKYSDGKNKC